MILTDREIRARAEMGMITPFEPSLIRAVDGVGKVLSYGLSSMGYDVRCQTRFLVTRDPADHPHLAGRILDPKNFDETLFEEKVGDEIVVPPHGFALGVSLETFSVPEDVLVVCMAKSSLARIGCIVGVTPLEPGWSGEVTMEFSNTTPYPIKLYPREGISQMLFFQASDAVETSYADRGGKYQNQVGITLPRL